MRRTIDFLYRHAAVTYVLMGVAFMLFGITSVDLFFTLKANINLFVEYGATVIEDGALRQLVELLGMALLSIALFICFAAFERILIKRLMSKWVASQSHPVASGDATPASANTVSM
jgi:hypothetical protein